MLVRSSSYPLDAVCWVGVGRGLGVVVRLDVGSDEGVGGSDGSVSVLKEVRVED